MANFIPCSSSTLIHKFLTKKKVSTSYIFMMRFVIWVSILMPIVLTSFVPGNPNTALSPSTFRQLLIKHGGVDPSHVDLDDYRPVDPSPSSKKVRPSPIQHGTPLIPYIPKPSPPPPPPPQG